MGFFTSEFLGVRLFIWVYFLISLIGIVSVAIYYYREKIRKKYYEFRFPEKLIKIVMHYKSGQFKEYWRIIPDDFFFTIQGKNYEYQDSCILKQNNFYVYENKQKELKVKIDGKEYDLDSKYKIEKRKSKYPEIHYYYNVSKPVKFEFEDKKVEFSAKESRDFKENDLFNKLLTLEGEKNLLKFLILIAIGNAGISIFILAKIMEWI